jgi:hypothetical protein
MAAIMVASIFIFAQCSDGKDSGSSRQAKFVRVDRETPEMQAKRAEFYKRGEERIAQAVASGKMEQPRADYLLKWMASDKAFKDANPEWTKYFFAGKGKNCEGKKDGKKFEGKKDGKDWAAKREEWKKNNANKADRPKLSAAEKKAKFSENYQARLDKINQKASEGKIDKDRAAFMLKWMAHDKAFKDANPEWADYGFFGRKFHGKDGAKGDRAKKAK